MSLHVLFDSRHVSHSADFALAIREPEADDFCRLCDEHHEPDDSASPEPWEVFEPYPGGDEPFPAQKRADVDLPIITQDPDAPDDVPFEPESADRSWLASQPERPARYATEGEQVEWLHELLEEQLATRRDRMAMVTGGL